LRSITELSKMTNLHLTTALGQLRLIGFLEGLSFIILLGIAMPLKYTWNMPEAVRIIGLAHGILFIVYNLYVIRVQIQRQWSLKVVSLAMAASFLPFGTFYADAKIFRKETGEKR
jgi:integral membrane protein